MKSHLFKDKVKPSLLADYDVIGFDVDNCIAKYNVKAYSECMTKTYLEDLVTSCEGYPEEVKKYDPKLLMLTQLNNGCVWDIDNGTLLKLGEDKQVLAAIYGFTKLSQREVQEMYGNPPIYTHLKWPETNRETTAPNGKGNHWVFMGYFEAFLCQVVSQVVDAISQGILKKTFNQVAFDLMKLFHTHNFKQAIGIQPNGVKMTENTGRMVAKVFDNPQQFILN